MFRDRTNAAATLVIAACLALPAWRFMRWATTHAIWRLPPETGSAMCRAAKGEGACWAVIDERLSFILFGGYPPGARWRPLLVCVLFIAVYGASAVPSCWRPRLMLWWTLVPLAAVVLLRGGFAGLSSVPTDQWGGLPLTFLLATIGFAAALPAGVVLALGRRARMPAVRILSSAYIELFRGVPLVTMLFMASLMFPLFVPQRFSLDKLLRAQVAIVMVVAAYLAEVVRAGLQGVPRGQYEAAASMGLRFWPATLLIVLPQAIRISIPALVNTFIAFFKDTSLVAVIGLFDLLGTAKAVIADAKWIGFGVEVYLFVAALYFAFCYAVSRYSQRAETILLEQSHG